ncbi:MAG: nucleotidyltransferase family protein [Candidatus Lokiarchaeota archaeon]|nr:nucleotidyltransferase family protein [Candidatus Lokiarchaeota archaeon]
MVKNKEEILETIKNVKNKLNVDYRVKTIGIFGSYISDTQTAMSDIDFLVEFENDADLLHFIGLSRYLEELFNTKVDVKSKPSLKEELKKNILESVIYE